MGYKKMSTAPSSSFNAFLDSNLSTVGAKGPEPFPIVDKLWDIFAGKGIRTVFLSVGTSKSPLADLEISESLGCPLHVCTLNDTETAQWKEVATVLKERKASGSRFTELVETKWILPKNLRVSEAVPWWTNGTIDLSGTKLSTQHVESMVASLCEAMKLKDSAQRIDVLKVDTTQSVRGLEIPVLASLLSAGYRPSVVIVKWSTMPDVDIKTTLAAGHLQCCGYTLLKTLDDKFIYYYNDDNLYELCSWEQRTEMNPIANEIIKATTRRR